MKYTKRTSAYVDLDAISYNMKEIQKHFPKGMKSCAVIKTDGYGHGAVQIAHKLSDQADFFAVATAGEAHELREGKVNLPILILGYCWEEDYDELIETEVRMPLFKEKDAVSLAEAAKRIGKTAKVHIKVDTGMSRIGFAPTKENAQIVRRIRKMDGIEVEGIFTHFARADEIDKAAALEQYRHFSQFIDMVEDGEEPIPIHHCANSAASMEIPETWVKMDMNRIGISLYGLYPSDEVDQKNIVLRPALEWKSEIVYMKTLQAGRGIGYGHTKILDTERLVATVPVGYGDGYPRLLSNKASVLIRGRRAPILGRVCMDQFMVDVTDIPGAAEGDMVTLVGFDGEEQISVEELSAICGRFNYEFVCDIGKRVPRIYRNV